MRKLLGAALIIGGTAAMGFSAARGLAQRVSGLGAVIAALELAERELSFRLTPIPELLDELSRRAPAPAGAFFAGCLARLDRLGERSLGELWDEAIEEQPMGLAAEDREILSRLGRVLGRYDGGGQQEAVALARVRLEHNLAAAEADRDSRGRLYGALGLTAGSFFAILLL
ncbi:stage III sporulation protein AB [Pseudoflavonifractor sp. 524-17]|uniref:stage III sporulation protein AB n=1 Tax=Pseudoflavonifractor sp. 524-17 TaxID=2304577 RepID=UPI00137AE429|nr:stage III sporulation protein AB [Pseudoflavonifractor sp. 524-17]NCE64301.1 stage III sporulation protein AB [Pseudoflavonifractor sp. 524-17]